MKYLFTILASLLTSALMSQSLPNVAIGVVEDSEGISFISEPKSTIVVDLTLTTTRFTAGEYARYAQRYLGERVQLSNRTITSIENLSVTLAPDNFLLTTAEVDFEPKTSTLSPAERLAVDRTSADILTIEQRAQACAQRIFKSRALCRELISGDIGEGVFGAGLASALERFNSEERELCALFMGREHSEQTSRRFVINPQRGTTRYIICRFDPQRGVLPSSDVDGEAIYLQITPAQLKDTTYVTATGKYPTTKEYITPNYARCDLYVGADIMNTVELPLYQYGSRVTVVYDKK